VSEISNEERARIYMHGVETERTRAVAHLRAMAVEAEMKREPGDLSDLALDNAADEIERGDHLKGQGEGA
jgi:hypothetical protein